MTNRLFKSVMSQMQSVLAGRKAGVLSENGVVVASTESDIMGDPWDGHVLERIGDSSNAVSFDGFTFKRFGGVDKTDYIAFCEGEDQLSETTVGIMSVSLIQVKQFYDEKYDKISFIKNILSDNIMPGDITSKAKTLHLNTEVYRIAFLIRVEKNESDNEVFNVVSSLFPNESRDFVIYINETDVVLLKEVKENTSHEDLMKIAETIVDTAAAEIMTKITIGIGTIVSTIFEVNRSYKDACVALEVGKVFDHDLTIISYNNLGIGRLIYQLPTKLCQLFLDEVFKKGEFELLDDETIVTIQKFFENSLNVSSASRSLFVHRNTLVYRLDKIYKLTGLDLRKFDDAIIFKVAMMVRKYLGADTLNM